MAADKKDSKKAAPAAAGEVDEGKQKKKKLMIMIGAGLLLVLMSVGGTVGALKFFSPHAKTDEASASPAPAADLPTPERAAIYYALKPNFTVNYDVNGRQRFLQTELTFTYRDPALLPTLELHMPAVRNALVLLLSSQNFDDLQTAEGKENLRIDALETVQEILDQEQLNAMMRMPKKEREKFEKEHGGDEIPNIEQVLFTNFVMQ